jgi:hypothetical protein
VAVSAAPAAQAAGNRVAFDDVVLAVAGLRKSYGGREVDAILDAASYCRGPMIITCHTALVPTRRRLLK